MEMGMYVRTGEKRFTRAMLAEMDETEVTEDVFIPFQSPVSFRPTKAQMIRKPLRIAPYEPCACGSGKKFKFCCYAKERK